MWQSSRGPLSRARNSCTNCRRGHFRCSDGLPCQRCSTKALRCTYVQKGDSLQFKRWLPGETKLTAKSDCNSPLVCGESSFRGFVSENHKLEACYQVGSESSIDERGTHRETTPHDYTTGSRNSSPAAASDSEPLNTVSDATEAFFLERYCNVIGPWFDLFDTSNRHWTNTIPYLSLNNRSLFAAILSSCAKQYTLVSGEKSVHALDYYNRGLSELSQALGSPATVGDVSIFASCLLIGYCEMINARGADWQTHLQGTHSLTLDRGWHGQCGGAAQSCFWVYCRMDLLASIARSQYTLLDPLQWLPRDSSLGPARQENDDWGLDSWCNQVVLLLARTHNLFCDVQRAQETQPSSQASSLLEQNYYLIDRWTATRNSLKAHERVRPTAFQAIAELPPLDANIPFPRKIYISAAACAASQMLDVARFFCLLAYPGNDQTERKDRLMSSKTCRTALDLARRIVSNSITNRHPTAWVNAVQLLSSVGPVLPSRGERDALLQILAAIHCETGWSVSNHAQMLNERWEQNDRVSQQQDYDQTFTGQDPALRYVGVSLLLYGGY